jgi:hypothetical protein
MRVQLNDPTLYVDLYRYLRAHDYLVLRERDYVEVVPISARGDRADRARLQRNVGAWLASHPDTEAIVDERRVRPRASSRTHGRASADDD